MSHAVDFKKVIIKKTKHHQKIIRNHLAMTNNSNVYIAIFQPLRGSSKETASFLVGLYFNVAHVIISFW